MIRTTPPKAGGVLGLLALLNSQLGRFVMVGVVNSAFSFAIFAGLQLTLGHRVHYLMILVISHVAGVLEAYVLQRWLVFRVRGRWWRDLVRFWSVYLVALGVNLVALPLLVEVVHVPVLPAQAIVMLGTAMGTFLVHRSFTFRRPREKAARSEEAQDGPQPGPKTKGSDGWVQEGEAGRGVAPRSRGRAPMSSERATAERFASESKPEESAP